MEEFGKAFRAACPDELRESNGDDAFFILAFAMVMLNSDLHNPAVKQRMSLKQFRRNMEGAIVLTDEATSNFYLQVLRCEMLEGSYFTSKLSKSVWLVKSLGPLGYKRHKKASVTLCAGELTVDGTSESYSLRNCIIARNLGGSHLNAIRNSGGSDMQMLHILKMAPDDDLDLLLVKRYSGDLIITSDDIDDLKDLQRAMSAHLLPGVQTKLNNTYRNIQQRLSSK
jgi:hypothetical protein